MCLCVEKNVWFFLGPNPRKSKQTMVDVDEISQIKKDKFSYKLLEENNNKVWFGSTENMCLVIHRNSCPTFNSSPQCRIHASVNRASIGADKANRRQANI